MQQADETLAELEARRQKAPADPAPALALAQLLDSRGRVAEAGAQYERYVSLAREGGAGVDGAELGRAHFRLERWEQAVEALGPVVAADPGLQNEQRLLGLALAHLGRDAEARRHLEAAAVASSDDAASQYVLGIVRARLGDVAAAAESFESVLELRPDRLDAVKSLGLAYDHLGRQGPAIEQFRRYLEAAPRDLEVRRRLAKDLELADRMDEAIAAYRATLALDPNEAATRYRLAWLLATNGAPEHRDGPTALDMARQLNAENQQHAALLDLLAAAYAETGQFEQAQRLADEAVELARSAGDEALADQIGSRRALYASGRPFHGAS